MDESYAQNPMERRRSSARQPSWNVSHVCAGCCCVAFMPSLLTYLHTSEVDTSPPWHSDGEEHQLTSYPWSQCSVWTRHQGDDKGAKSNNRGRRKECIRLWLAIDEKIRRTLGKHCTAKPEGRLAQQRVWTRYRRPQSGSPSAIPIPQSPTNTWMH